MSTGNGNYDYTREPVGSSDDAEELTLRGFAAPVKTADDIEKENSFYDIPPGDHLLVVHSFGKVGREKYKVFVDGRMESYEGIILPVVFALPGEPQFRIRDTFILPPMDPREQRAYFEGKKELKDKTGGLNASKFLHFIARLGFDYPPGGQLPEAALSPRNWKGRAIHATVTPGKDWTDKEGKTRKGWNQIKMFSYRRTEGAAAIAPETIPASHAAAAAGGLNSAPAPQPVTRPAAQPTRAESILKAI